MADDLLFVYTSPGTADTAVAEYNDWYDNEHVPMRVELPGFGAVARWHAADRLRPDWLATYEVKPGTLSTPEYKALWANASEREKRIMSTLATTMDRRVYSLISDSWADGCDPRSGAGPVLMAVSMSVPAAMEPEVPAYYEQEHFPLLLAAPGWRRARRYLLTSGTGPKYLSLHEVESLAALETPEYKAATSTPWRNRIVESAVAREKRVFRLHRAFC
jgi:hypothetical protein